MISPRRKRIVNVVGARPNFIKIAPLMAAYRAHPGITPTLVHTGQHYDQQMSRRFFEELGIPPPDVNLEVGSGTHATQTARIMVAFEEYCAASRPDIVVVVGDVNSTIACALVAAKLGIVVAHVEAGLRSFDRTMPEEVNRLLTDAIADFLFVSEESGLDNLKREGVDGSKVHFVGNVMIDTLLANRKRAEKSDVLRRLGLDARPFVTLTLHRPSNVDDPRVLTGILDSVHQAAREVDVVFPAHPRTVRRMQESGLGDRLSGLPGLRVIEPLGYLDFLRLLADSRAVLTDSGGVQEETTILGVPCITLRENTERPVTCSVGTNRLVGMEPGRIVAALRDALEGRRAPGGIPPLWDGRAAERIAAVLAR